MIKRILAAAVTAALATPAFAGQWLLTRDGSLLPRTTPAKSQAFCQANPNVAVAFDETLTTTPAAGALPESAGTVAITAAISVQAVCLAGTSEIRIRYGDLRSGTASPGTDYQAPTAVVVGTGALPQFTTPVAATAGGSLQILNDTVQEPAESIHLGIVSGELILTQAGGFFEIIDLAPPAAPAVVLSIIDDDDLNPTTITNNLAPLAAGDPVAAAAVAPFAATCAAEAARPLAQQNAELIAQCRAITNSTTAATVIGALRAISGEEVSSQLTSSQDNANFMTQGVSQRLAALRGGATSQSIEDLAFNINGQSLPGQALAALLGLSAAAGQDDSGGTGGGLLDARLGVFLNITARDGDRDANQFEVGFDYEGFQALAGVDYRFTERFVGGVALGFGKIDTDLDLAAGYLDTQSFSGTVYGSFAPTDSWYADFALGYMANDYDQGRVVDLRTLGTGFARRVAVGSTDGRQWSVSGSTGYVFAFGATSLTPNLRMSYARTEIDGFTESGGGINDLIFPDQAFRSLQFAAGTQLSRAISLDSGVLSPYVNLEIARELQNDAYNFAPQLRLRPERPSTPVFINASDRTFGRGEVGLMYLRPGGLQWSLSYSQMLGYRDLSARNLQLGLRLEF